METNVRETEVSETARKAVRLSFNPSGEDEVHQIKILTGTLISILERIGQRHDKRHIADCVVAIRHVQTASMWSVFAATAHLP